MKGSDFFKTIQTKTGSSREKEIAKAIELKLIPNFLNDFAEIKITSGTNKLSYFVSKDYFSIGTDEDFILMPCIPKTIKPLLEIMNCSLPTKTMVEKKEHSTKKVLASESKRTALPKSKKVNKATTKKPSQTPKKSSQAKINKNKVKLKTKAKKKK
jgi:hypothetical protein